MLVRAMTMMAIDWKTIGLSLPRIAVSNHSDNTNDISRSFFLLQNRNSPEPAREAAPPDAPWPRRRRRYFLRDRSAAARGPGLSRDRAHRSLARCLAAEVQVDAQGGELMGREREREREREGREREGRGGIFDGRSQPLSKKKKKHRHHQVGASAWSLAVVATLLGLSHPAVDKVCRAGVCVRERVSVVESALSRPLLETPKKTKTKKSKTGLALAPLAAFGPRLRRPRGGSLPRALGPGAHLFPAGSDGEGKQQQQ